MNTWLPAPASDHGMFVEIARAGAAAMVILALFLAAERWKRRDAPPVEWTRKLVHVGAALVAATFPWLFAHSVTVFGLGAVFAVVIAVTRRRRLFGSFHCVERKSEGGFFFLIAVCALFAVGRERPLFYLISLLVLMLADSSAAIVGTTWGRRLYSIKNERRSIEGSLVFLGVALLSICGPLLLLSDLDRSTAVVASLQLALLVTCVEAISTRGIDNLLVPLATFALLLRLTAMNAASIAVLLAVEVTALGALALLSRRERVRLPE